MVVLPKYHTDYEIIQKNRIFETSHSDIKLEERDVKKSLLILDSFEILYLKKLNPISGLSLGISIHGCHILKVSKFCGCQVTVL